MVLDSISIDEHKTSAPIVNYGVVVQKWHMASTKQSFLETIAFSSRRGAGRRIKCRFLSLMTEKNAGSNGFTGSGFGPGFRVWAEMTDSWTSQTPSN